MGEYSRLLISGQERQFSDADQGQALVSEERESNRLAVEAGRKKRGPSYLRRLLLVLLSTLVSFAICEMGLRLFWHNPYRHEAPEHILKLPVHHALTDHLVDRSAIDPERPEVRFRTDERSYILPSRRFEAPDATVAFLGGSTTECIAVQEELRFPARVSYLLEEKGLRVNTLNAGRSASTTHDCINVLLNHIVEDKPDVVVLMEATNDIGVLSHSESYQPRMGGTEDFSRSARFVLQKASSTFYFMGLFRKLATAATLTPETDTSRREGQEKVQLPLDEYEKRLRAFVRISRAFGIEPVLMTQPLANIRNAFTPDWTDPINQEVFNDKIRKVGAEENVAVIDLVSHLIENVEGWNQHMKIFYDGVHVNDSGSEVYAEHIAERLFSDVLARRIRR